MIIKRTSNSPTKIIAIAIFVAIVILAIILSKDKMKSTIDSSNTPTKTIDTPKNTPSIYKNGNYTAEGTYITPGGRESINLTITISDDAIKDSSLIQKAKTPEAQEYQARFASEYKSTIIGKKVRNITLTRVAGSSLTPVGFNRALKQIKTDATI